MKTLNLDEKAEKLEVILKGKKIELIYPEWGVVEDMEKKGEENLQTEDIKAFLVGCGLPEDCIRTCQIKVLQELFSELMGLKKS